MDVSTLISLVLALIAVAAGYILFGDEKSRAQIHVDQFKKAKTQEGSRLSKFLKLDATNTRRQAIEESLTEIEETQKNRLKKRKSLKSKLIQADIETNATVFNILSFAAAGLLFLVTIVLTRNLIISLGVGIVLGIGLPRWVVNVIVNRRQRKFISHFADAMDIIVRGVRSGLPLGDCIKIIAHESPEPLASEFRLVVEGEAVGVPIEVCLDRMYERVPVSEVNFFNTVLNIQRTTGGNLAEALDNLSKVLRGRKLLAEKIKALSAEAKMSSVIIGALPFVVMLLVSIASPDYMTELYTTPTGHRNLMIGAGMMVLGTLMMKKMINFKY